MKAPRSRAAPPVGAPRRRQRQLPPPLPPSRRPPSSSRCRAGGAPRPRTICARGPWCELLRATVDTKPPGREGAGRICHHCAIIDTNNVGNLRPSKLLLGFGQLSHPPMSHLDAERAPYLDLTRFVPAPTLDELDACLLAHNIGCETPPNGVAPTAFFADDQKRRPRTSSATRTRRTGSRRRATRRRPSPCAGGVAAVSGRGGPTLTAKRCRAWRTFGAPPCFRARARSQFSSTSQGRGVGIGHRLPDLVSEMIDTASGWPRVLHQGPVPGRLVGRGTSASCFSTTTCPTASTPWTAMGRWSPRRRRLPTALPGVGVALRLRRRQRRVMPPSCERRRQATSGGRRRVQFGRSLTVAPPTGAVQGAVDVEGLVLVEQVPP